MLATLATSGPPSRTPSLYYDPDSSSSRTWADLQGSLPGLDGPSPTWPVSGTTRDGLCWKLPRSAPPTSVPGGSPSAGTALLPTPLATDSHGHTRRGGSRQLLPTPAAADSDRTSATYPGGDPTLTGALLPTPTVADRFGPGEHGTGGPNLRTVVDRLLPTRAARDWKGTGPADLDDLMLPSAVQPDRWGAYAPAIARWAAVLGRPAPDPTEPRAVTMRSVRACADDWGVDGWAAREAVRTGLWGPRLNPRFVEWMMGAPAGWVCDVPGVSRSAQLARLGNGVVRQQAAAAVRLLIGAP